MADGKLNYEISFSAETRILRNIEADLQRQIVAARLAGKSIGGMGDELARVQARLRGGGLFKNMSAEVSGMLSSIPGVGRVMGLLGGATGAAAAAFGGLSLAIAGSVKAINEFAAAQRNVAALDAVLAQNGQLTDDYRLKLQKLAAEMQSATAIADDQWIAVLTRLTQFGANPDNIEQYANAVKNLAGIVGDVETAANLLSRALQGNFDMFGRYGLRVSEAGTQTEKLDQLMQQLAQRGGGVLEAKARSISGQFQQLKNNASDLWEAFGRGIAQTGILQSTLTGLSNAFEYWAKKLGGPIDKLDGLTNKIKAVAPASDAIAARLAGITENMDALAAGADSASRALKNQLSALDDAADHTIALAEAQKELELAKLDASDLPAGEKENRKREIEEKLSATKFQAKQQAYASKVAALEADRVAETERFNELNRQRGELEALMGKAEKFDSEVQQKQRKVQTLSDMASESSNGTGTTPAAATAGVRTWKDVAKEAALNLPGGTLLTAFKSAELAGQLSAGVSGDGQVSATAQGLLEHAKKELDDLLAARSAQGIPETAALKEKMDALDRTIKELANKSPELDRSEQIAKLRAEADQRAKVREVQVQTEEARKQKKSDDSSQADTLRPTGTPSPNIPADRLAQVGLFLGNAGGSNTGLLSAAEKTARNTDRIARALENNRRDPSRRGDLTFDGGVK